MRIGLRIPGASGREPLADFAHWCRAEGFDAIDLGSPDPERVKTVRAAGLELGTFDLAGTSKLLSPDAAVRRQGVEAGIAAIERIADAGGDKAFCVFGPEDRNQSRRDSFANWKQSFPDVAAAAENKGVRIAMEGWPGGGPQYPALGVTPETWRAMFAAVPSEAFGLNYDPSHLVRVGVSYLRALDEFGGRVIHVHGKDTAFDAEATYLYGRLGPTFAKPVGFSEGWWRYTIPGEGVVNWGAVAGKLQQFGFDGTIAVELEDFRYNGTYEGEKRGLSRARAHLLQYF